MKLSLSAKEWVGIPQEKRQKLAIQFRVGKSSPTEVINNQLVCDGTNEKDLQALSVGKMIEFLGDDLAWFKPDLFNNLLTLVLFKLDGQIQAHQSTSEITEVRTEEIIPRRRGRPKKKTE